MEAWRLSFPTRWLIRSSFLLATCVSAHAQVTVAAGIAPGRVPDKVQAVPRVPGLGGFLDGLNAGVSYSSVHSSSVGWYSVTTPAVNYTFSRRFSADASTSLYFNRLVQNTNTATATAHPLVNDRVDPGDTLIGFHAFFEPGSLQDTITASLTAPTGDRAKGFGTGQATYDFSNHLERYFNQLGVVLDLGGGNSSGLFNDLVVKDYNSVGGLAHFESGLVYWFPHRSYIEAVAYEQLPLGSQTVYRTVARGENGRAEFEGGHAEEDGGGTPPPPPPPPVATTVTTVSEDNGFTTFVGIPVTPHITVSGYYNRSLRQRLDTVSFGVTYVLRGAPKKRLSMIDRALREAENTGQK
jgi:hypothetical protein